MLTSLLHAGTFYLLLAARPEVDFIIRNTGRDFLGDFYPPRTWIKITEECHDGIS